MLNPALAPVKDEEYRDAAAASLQVAIEHTPWGLKNEPSIQPNQYGTIHRMTRADGVAGAFVEVTVFVPDEVVEAHKESQNK